MTDADLTLIATRIMDRAERDKALHLSSIVEELAAGLAIVKGRDERTPIRPENVTSSAAIMQALQNAYYRQHNEQLNKAMKQAMAYGQGSFIVRR